MKSPLVSQFAKTVPWSFRLAWKSSPRLFSTIITCFSLESVIPVTSTAAIGILISKYKVADPFSSTGIDAPVFWVSLIIGLMALQFILAEIRNFSRIRIVDETGISLQKELYLHAARMNLAFFERSTSLNKLFRASSGGGGSAFGPIQSTLAGASGMVQIFSLFGLMVYLYPTQALLLCIAGSPLLVVRSLSAIEKYKLSVRTTQRRRLSRYYTSRLSGAANVAAAKILGLADEMIERFEKAARSIIQEKQHILKRTLLRQSISAVFYVAVLGIVVIWLSHRLSLGEIEAEGMVIFVLAGFKTLRSIDQVSKAMAAGSDSSLAVIPHLNFLAEEPNIGKEGDNSPGSMSGGIILEDVSFTYPETEKKIIENLSITIDSGEKVAIIGGNGAGKTTLIKLIAKFYDIDSGQILIDGNKTEDLSVSWLHNHIGMVFQKPIQLEATVHDNIAFGDWERLKDQRDLVQDLAARVGLTDMIETLPDGFDTHLGKLFGETTLSQGQWQLLAVARALAREDAILLLDEPTSNLDINAEIAVFRTLKKQANNRTMILVSHRFSAAREMDRILVMDEGILVQDGTHDQLMAVGGYYADMVRHQARMDN